MTVHTSSESGNQHFNWFQFGDSVVKEEVYDDDMKFVKSRMSEFSCGGLKIPTYEVFGNMYG